MHRGNGFIMNNDKKVSSSKQRMLKIDFSTFILSLYSSALVQLGEIADPITGKKEQNFDIAKQTVDIIIMLEKKTQNNLNNEEKNLVTSLIHELKMAYVRTKK
ncbi:MAG: hypothetical protein B6I26_06840 [Desulfobacteraceae bacterium 4572_130]|nr:MAG: hypothetical protein B6I26_06840 [Desulfobacteraceae bacterium 4572_130]